MENCTRRADSRHDRDGWYSKNVQFLMDIILVDIIKRLKEDANFIKYNFFNHRILLCGENELEAAQEIEKLRAQRDAWKAEAEHQYGLLRAVKNEDVDYPTKGVLDAYAAGRHPALR